MDDRLQLEVSDLEVPVLTGTDSDRAESPRALRISLCVDLDPPQMFDPDTPLSASKDCLDLKHAATGALPQGVRFTLIEAVADHICETLFLQDVRVRRVRVRIVQPADAAPGESVGITLVRHRR